MARREHFSQARVNFLKKIKTFGLKQTMFAVRRAAKPTYTTTVHKSYKNKAIKNGIQFKGSARHCDHFAGALGGFPLVNGKTRSISL